MTAPRQQMELALLTLTEDAAAAPHEESPDPSKRRVAAFDAAVEALTQELVAAAKEGNGLKMVALLLKASSPRPVSYPPEPR